MLLQGNSLAIGHVSSLLGVHPQTVRRWCRKGMLPEPARTLGNHRRFPVPEKKSGMTIGYVRVSSHDQKKDLVVQKDSLSEKSSLQNIVLDSVIEDIGSGMNYKKKGFLKLMNLLLSGQVFHLVVMHRDRLLRFGSELVFLICRAFGVKVTILEESPASNPVEQLALDLVEIVTVFSSKLYGMRSGLNKKTRKSQGAQLCSGLEGTA
jgi:predicted site-specific integrase-resolvase